MNIPLPGFMNQFNKQKINPISKGQSVTATVPPKKKKNILAKLYSPKNF